MKIRVAQTEDAGAVWCTHTDAIRVLCRHDYSPVEIDAWAGPRKPEDYLASIDGRRMLVAEIDGRIVGFGDYLEDEIRAVYVHSDVVRRGVGRALFIGITDAMNRRGIRKAWLDASLTSVPFYLAMGCTSGPKQEHQLSSGVKIACVRMSFEIQTASQRSSRRPGAARLDPS